MRSKVLWRSLWGTDQYKNIKPFLKLRVFPGAQWPRMEEIYQYSDKTIFISLCRTIGTLSGTVHRLANTMTAVVWGVGSVRKITIAKYREVHEGPAPETDTTMTWDIQPRQRWSDIRIRLTVLQWPSQSPDLTPVEHLWRELNMAVHSQFPSSLPGVMTETKSKSSEKPKRHLHYTALQMQSSVTTQTVGF